GEVGRGHPEERVSEGVERAGAEELLPFAGGDRQEGLRLERLPEHDRALAHHDRPDVVHDERLVAGVGRAEAVEQDREVHREHHVVAEILDRVHHALPAASLRLVTGTPRPLSDGREEPLKAWKRAAISLRSARMRSTVAPASAIPSLSWRIPRPRSSTSSARVPVATASISALRAWTAPRARSISEPSPRIPDPNCRTSSSTERARASRSPPSRSSSAACIEARNSPATLSIEAR